MHRRDNQDKPNQERIRTMDNDRPVILFFDPADETVPRELRPERRRGEKDRRKLHTYIFNDRRSGRADRRKRL